MDGMSRKHFWVPVVVLAVAFGGFQGYGAYTRSKPVDYGRGGVDFAAVTPATPKAGTTESAATPSPTASASRAPSLRRAEVTAAAPRVTAGAVPQQVRSVPDALALPRA